MGKVEEHESKNRPPSAPEGTVLPAGTLIAERYRVVRFIGQGGNGTVHEVEHVLTGRRLALKSLHDEAAYGRLEQEARATSLMKNPHVVQVTDMGAKSQAGPFLVMELLDGQSLRELLDDAGQLPLELTVNIALQVCECLAEAHSHGIVHRDLKPDNVFLCEGAAGHYDVKVLDFGVVKIAPDGPIPNSSLTRTGSTVGTPFYMSLEQLRNSSAVDQRADVYALGVVVYESLSGRKPFQAETIGELVYALCSAPATHLHLLRPDLPAAACEVVMKALSAPREDRQTTMTELASQLLPFGNPAFGLWLRPDAKRSSPRALRPSAAVQSQLARTPPSVRSRVELGELGPDLDRAPDASPKTGSSPTLREAAPPARELADLREDERAVASRTQAQDGSLLDPLRSPIDLPTGDRDTPTHMFFKPAHSTGTHSFGGDEDSIPTGDRDTPTRAIEAPARREPSALPPIRRPKSVDEFASATPIAESAGPAPDPSDSIPSSRPSHVPGLLHDGSGSIPHESSRSSAIPQDPGGGSMPAHFVSAVPGPPNPALVRPVGPHAAYSVSPAANANYPNFRPGWQRGLDGVLTGVGRGLELFFGALTWLPRKLAGYFRAVPASMQIAVVILAASALAILVLYFVQPYL